MDISYKISANDKNYRFNYRVAAIIESHGKILINKVVKDDFCFLAGGRVQIGETAQNALARELKEELDIDVQISGLAFIVENFFEYEGESFHEMGLFFKIDGSGLTLPEDGEIRDDIQFFWREVTDVSDLNLKPEFLTKELVNMSDLTQHFITR